MTDHPPLPRPGAPADRRLQALHTAGLDHAGAEPAFDRLARVASRLLGTPISFVSILDARRQLFKGGSGLPEPLESARESPAEHSFCQYVVAGDAPLLVEDARLHPELSGTPAVREMALVAYAGMPLRTPDGQVLGALCVMDTRPRAWTDEEMDLLTDLTAAAATEVALRLELAGRRRAEAEAERCHAEFETLAEHAPDIVVRVDRAGRHLYVNPAVERATGLPARAFLGRTNEELGMPPAQVAQWRQAREAVFRTGEPQVVEFAFDGPAGRRWFDSRLAPEPGPDGEVVTVLGVTRDVTELREAEAAVRESERFLRAAVDALAAHIVILDEQGTVIAENEAWRRVAHEGGAPDGSVGIGSNYLDVCDAAARAGDDDAATVAASLRAVIAREAPAVEHEYPCRVGDTSHWYLMRATPFGGEGPVRVLVAHEDVTARHEAQTALRTSEERFRALIENSADVMDILEPDGRIRYVSPSVERLLGYAPEELVGHDSMVLLHPDEVPEIRAKLAADMAQPGLGTAVELTLRHADGSWRVFEAQPNNLLDNPAVRGIVINARDVTARRRAEEALRRSERQFRALIRGAHDVIAVLDAEGRVRFASPSAGRMLGTGADELPGQGLDTLIHPDDLAAVRAALARGLAEPDVPGLVDCRVRTADGRWRLVEAVATNLLHDPDVAGIVVNARDVTERHSAQAALRSSEERFRLLVETVRDYAILMLDTDGYLVSWNAGAERFFGYTAEQVLGRHHRIFAPAEEPGHETDERLATAAREGRHEDEGWRTRADGTRFWANAILTALHDEGGRLVGFAKVTRDLTERRLAEEALRRSESRLAGIVGSAMDAILTVGEDQRVLVFNAAAERMFDIPAAQALGAPLSRFVPERFRAAHACHVDEYARAGTTTRAMHPAGRLFGLRADGTEFPIEATISRVEADGTRLLTVIVRDITERLAAEAALRASEEQLRLAQRMESIGRLAGGIAHDFNNLLMAIGGHTQLLLRRTPEGEAGRWNLEEVKKGVDRAAALTQQLLAFSRRQVLQPRVLSLNAVVGDLRRMLERLIGEDVELVTRLDPRAGQVRADASQMEQVVMNLAVNARDAMPDGGVIVIESRPATLTADDTARYPYVVPGPYVLLTVTDTGHGMDPATMERIFEPFFTTKEPGKGTGLGLSTVYGIVKQSGGYVWVNSKPGTATTFRVYLPRVDAPVDEDEPVPPATAPPRGTETVLLAEDEEAVRTLVATVLRDAGYRVLEAADGHAALRAAAGYDGPIDLLLTDVVMPGMGGPDLARHLAVERPGTRALYLSGYSDAVARHGILGEGAVFVQKPVSPDALVTRVRELLDAPVERR